VIEANGFPKGPYRRLTSVERSGHQQLGALAMLNSGIFAASLTEFGRDLGANYKSQNRTTGFLTISLLR